MEEPEYDAPKDPKTTECRSCRARIAKESRACYFCGRPRRMGIQLTLLTLFMVCVVWPICGLTLSAIFQALGPKKVERSSIADNLNSLPKLQANRFRWIHDFLFEIQFLDHIEDRSPYPMVMVGTRFDQVIETTQSKWLQTVFDYYAAEDPNMVRLQLYREKDAEIIGTFSATEGLRIF